MPPVQEGGVTSWASSGAVLNALRDENPSLLEALAGDWWMDRKGEVAGGEDPVFSMPILNYHKVRVRTDRGAMASPGVPPGRGGCGRLRLAQGRGARGRARRRSAHHSVVLLLRCRHASLP